MTVTEIKNYKILIADDEPSNLESIFIALSECNFQILLAINGQLCYEVAKNNCPALIIMDWEMPDLNGIEAIKLLKSDEVTKKIPIIMATGKMTTSENLQTAFEAGAIDFIRKPVVKIELLARVKSILQLYNEIDKNYLLEKQIAQQQIALINQTFEKNQKHLTATTLRLIQYGEMIKKVIIDLLDVDNHTDYDGKQKIKRIINGLRLKSSNKNWKQFEILFEQVHLSFYEKLIQKFPEITANERKMCAFYKLNMSAKDICAITFQSENALKKARARLRQKLGIDTNTKLSVFIQSL